MDQIICHDPTSPQWGETVIKGLLGRAINGPDDIIQRARDRHYTLEFRCHYGNQGYRVYRVEVFMRGPGLDDPLLIGAAERPDGDSFHDALETLAESVRAQLQLACT